MSSAPAAQPTCRLSGRSAERSAREVAAMLDTLAAADQQLADALDSISSSRVRVSSGTVTALERVLATLRPAAEVRAQLRAVDRRVLAAAIRLRRVCHDPHLRVVDARLLTGVPADDQH